MKNSNNTIGNRTRDLPACKAEYVQHIHWFWNIASLSSFISLALSLCLSCYKSSPQDRVHWALLCGYRRWQSFCL